MSGVTELRVCASQHVLRQRCVRVELQRILRRRDSRLITPCLERCIREECSDRRRRRIASPCGFHLGVRRGAPEPTAAGRPNDQRSGRLIELEGAPVQSLRGVPIPTGTAFGSPRGPCGPLRAIRRAPTHARRPLWRVETRRPAARVRRCRSRYARLRGRSMPADSPDRARSRGESPGCCIEILGRALVQKSVALRYSLLGVVSNLPA